MTGDESVQEIKGEMTATSHRTIFQGGERDYSVDIVRCVSCFMVIAGHTFWFIAPASGFSPMEPGCTAHYLSLLLRCTFTCGTDIFLMISGIFFLAPERNIRPAKIWKKNITKMACAYVLWMILYALADLMYAGEPFTFKEVLITAVHQDQRHLWYIPMMLSIYIFVPLMRVFTAHAEVFHYRYLFVAVAITSVLNQFMAVNRNFLYYGAEGINIGITRMPVVLFSNYFMLSILGYWFYAYSIKRRSRVLIYILGLAGIFSMYVLCALNYDIQGVMDTPDFLGKFVAGNIFKCSAIFLLFTTLFKDIRLPGAVKKVLLKISNATLFIYLFHWMMIEFLIRNGWLMTGWWTDHLILAGFIYVFSSYFVGFVFSALILQGIPWKKMRDAVLGAVIPGWKTRKDRKDRKDRKGS